MEATLAKARRNVIHSVTALTCIGVFIGAFAAQAEGALHSILDRYRQECVESSPIFYGIDADLEAAEYAAASAGQTPQLILGDSIIYELPLGPSGDIATVLYRDFHCSNDTRARCGTGGCGFYVIIDELIFVRRSGFRPGVAVLDGQGVLLIPIHGSGCIDANGDEVSGAENCHIVATWNVQDRSFNSVGGGLRLETE